ncbi:hypothetical protein QQX98_010182 [Neonectria punicea]|uniref:RBR-type E3 ubiquitin transferase n=1 Tax=Neonectria punicea TaxID=979145 RepID=A0ABR1GQ28_9HYPO
MGDRNDDPFQRAHPDLVDLLFRHDVFPEGDIDELSEHVLAEAIGLAISLADIDEQLQILSRIMTDQEVAAQGLQHPDVQNLDLRIPLTADERALVLRQSPEPDPADADAARGARDRRDCLICGETAHLVISCGCAYCRPCLRDAIRVGLRSENDFPPRCCASLHEDTIRRARRPGLVHLFRMLAAEVQVPAPDRLYCHDGTCATFIPPGSRGVCLGCGMRTCEACGRRGHEGLERCGDGAEDGEALEDVWASMDRNGIVNCPGCGRMVSLRDGCNHMRCACGTEFCYICGGDWRACFCPTWRGDENMVPVRDRPGLKPERWRRPRRVEAGAPRAVIPQLRPAPGERPLAWDVPRRRVLAPARDGPARNGPSRNGQRPVERPVERPVARPPIEHPIERDFWLPPDIPLERPIDRDFWLPVNRPADGLAEVIPPENPFERPLDRGWDDFRHAVHNIERDRPRHRHRPRPNPMDAPHDFQDPLAIPRQYWRPAIAVRRPASLYYVYVPQHPGSNTVYYYRFVG